MPYRPQGRTINTSASIGIATTEDPTATADALVSHADSAMYRAKDSGRGRYEVFDAETHAAERARSTAEERLIAELTVAVHEGQFDVHYQPIVDLQPPAAEAGVYAVEALVRWHHPTQGLLPAARLHRVGHRRRARRRHRRVGARRGLPADDGLGRAPGDDAPRRLFVNVSTRELADPRLPTRVADTLLTAGLAPQRLTLELTESGKDPHPERTAATLEEIRALGVELAIDDFGTGSSGFGRLLEMPGATVKVDQSLTRDLLRKRDAAAVVRSVLLLGHDVRRIVVVEGVENAATLERLQEAGCTHVQGFHLSRPKRATELEPELVDPPWVVVLQDLGY